MVDKSIELDLAFDDYNDKLIKLRQIKCQQRINNESLSNNIDLIELDCNYQGVQLTDEDVTYEKVKAARDELSTALGVLDEAKESHADVNNKYWKDLGYNFNTEDESNYWESHESVVKFLESYDPLNFNMKQIRENKDDK